MSYGSNNKFKVRFKVVNGYTNQIKNELDYKLARSLDFCRGHYIATRKTEWKCSKDKMKKINCETFFKCTNVSKDFTRESEQKRLSKKLVNKEYKNTYKIYVSKRPLGVSAKKSSKKLLAVKKAAPAKQVAKPLVFKDEGIELFNDDTVVDENVGVDPEPSIEEDLGSLLVDGESSDEEILDEVSDPVDNDSASISSKFNWLNFGLQYVSATDDGSNSYKSLGLSYTPTFKINESIYLRGEFGVHKFSIAETTLTESESFLVTNYLLHLDYIFSGGIYLTGGYGKQGWASTSLGSVSFTKLNYGVGYRLKKKALNSIDRLFITLASLSSSDSTVSAAEIQFGLGLSF
jgi:hypothetical protein